MSRSAVKQTPIRGTLPPVVRLTRKLLKQDQVSRKRRLSAGLCPIHGLSLGQSGVIPDQTGVIVECPRNDCDFIADVVKGSVLYKALHKPNL